MPLNEWLARIEQLHPKAWDPGLERVGEVARRLGVTRPAPKVVLVAGTNGKGSTCEAIDLIARHAGLSVGKTTSPHLIRFNERIVVDGVPCSDEEIVAAFESIDDARGDISLSYFEFGALAAMLIFRRRGVDLAVLEIGLGGRLDAMNVAEPDVGIIMRIALDHQDWLGDDREAIGREKAGIMRAGVPCLIGDRAPPGSLQKAADEVGALLRQIGQDFGLEPSGIDSVPVPDENLLTAIAACRELGIAAESADVRAALANWALPGRLQWRQAVGGARVLLDVAHNPDAATALADYLERQGVSGCLAVFGAYRDKDIAGVLAPVAPFVKDWFCTDIPGARGADADEIAAYVSAADGVVSGKYDKIADAFEAAFTAAEAGDTILVFGSFITVGGVLEALE